MELSLFEIVSKDDLSKRKEKEKTNLEKYKTEVDKAIVSKIRER
jgi:hypothetical protein